LLHSFRTFCITLTALSAATIARGSVTETPRGLPDAPSMVLYPTLGYSSSTALPPIPENPFGEFSSSEPDDDQDQMPAQPVTPGAHRDEHEKCVVDPGVEVDKNCKPIPLERSQPHRILGFMPNFRTVSAGAVVHPPGWAYNFHVATRQAFDYSSFIFLGLTSISAEGINSHPALGKGADGFYAYTWRGFLDKTDGTYLSAWFLPSLLHEDTRYYPLGAGHSVPIRALYVISRQGVARTYSGRNTPNIAGLGGKVLTQLVSRQYYPAGATSFSVLATKFGYSAMRDVAFSSIREFYPDIAAHYIRKHREKAAALAAHDAQAAGVPPTTQHE